MSRQSVHRYCNSRHISAVIVNCNSRYISAIVVSLHSNHIRLVFGSQAYRIRVAVESHSGRRRIGFGSCRLGLDNRHISTIVQSGPWQYGASVCSSVGISAQLLIKSS